VLACIAIGTLIIMLWLGQMTVQPILKAGQIAESITNGDLNNRIEVGSRDETGQMLDALSRMQTNLSRRIEEERELSSANGRVRQALDSVSRGVVTFDPRGGA